MLKRLAAPLLLSLVSCFATASDSFLEEPQGSASIVTLIPTYTHISSHGFSVVDLGLEAKLQQRMYCDPTGECIYTKLRLLIRKQDSENWIICLSHNVSLVEDYEQERELIKEHFFSREKPLEDVRYEDYAGSITLQPHWLANGWRGPRNQPYAGQPTKSWPLFWLATVKLEEDILINLVDECDLTNQGAFAVIDDEVDGWDMIPAINMRTGAIEPNVRFLSDLLANNHGNPVSHSRIFRF